MDISVGGSEAFTDDAGAAEALALAAADGAFGAPHALNRKVAASVMASNALMVLADFMFFPPNIICLKRVGQAMMFRKRLACFMYPE
ncbi:MAG: hypothetical protein RSC73_03175 [Ruthenibacterium sp.]